MGGKLVKTWDTKCERFLACLKKGCVKSFSAVGL